MQLSYTCMYNYLEIKRQNYIKFLILKAFIEIWQWIPKNQKTKKRLEQNLQCHRAGGKIAILHPKLVWNPTMS